MVEFELFIQHDLNTNVINKKMLLKASEAKTPEDFQKYVKAGYDATMKLGSENVNHHQIAENSSTVLLPAPGTSNQRRYSEQKPPSEKQIVTAHSICEKLKISPNEIAQRYKASRLEDMSHAQIWDFINQNKNR